MKLKIQMLKLKYLEDINQLARKTHAVEEIIEVYSWRISADKKYKNTHKGVFK